VASLAVQRFDVGPAKQVGARQQSWRAAKLIASATIPRLMKNARGESAASSRGRKNFGTFAPICRNPKVERVN
jgi:hypothetical protein